MPFHHIPRGYYQNVKSRTVQTTVQESDVETSENEEELHKEQKRLHGEIKEIVDTYRLLSKELKNETDEEKRKEIIEKLKLLEKKGEEVLKYQEFLNVNTNVNTNTNINAESIESQNGVEAVEVENKDINEINYHDEEEEQIPEEFAKEKVRVRVGKVEKVEEKSKEEVEYVSLKNEIKKIILKIEEIVQKFITSIYDISEDFPKFDYGDLEYTFTTIEVNKELENILLTVKNITAIIYVYSCFDKTMNGNDVNNFKEPNYVKGYCNYILKRIISNIIFMPSGSVIPILQKIESYLLMMDSYIDLYGIDQIRSDMLLKPLKDYDFIWDYKVVKSVFSGIMQFRSDKVVQFLINLYQLYGKIKIVAGEKLIKKLALRKPELVISITAFFDRFEVLSKVLSRNQFSGNYIDFFHLVNEMIIILNELNQLIILTKMPSKYEIPVEFAEENISHSLLGELSQFLDGNLKEEKVENEEESEKPKKKGRPKGSKSAVNKQLEISESGVRGVVYLFTKLDKVTDPVTGKVSYPCAYCEKLESSKDFNDFITWFKTPKIRNVMYFQKVNTQTDYGLLFAEACFCKNIPTLLSGLNMYQGVKGTITIEELRALIEGNQDYVKYEHGKRETTKTHFLDIMGFGFGHQMKYILGYIILEKYGIMKYVLSEEDLMRKFLEDNVNPVEYFNKRLR